MTHAYERFVFDHDRYQNGWLCLQCHKFVDIEESPDGPPNDPSECVPVTREDQA